MCPPLIAAIPAAVGAAASATAGAASGIGLGTVASLAGTGLSAYGAIQQANAQKAAADAQAAAYNRQAAETLQQGQYQALRRQEEIDKTIGSSIALGGGSGVDLGSGSFADVISTIASNGALDIGAIQANALGKAQNLTYQARLARQGGKSAQRAGFINAVGGVAGDVTRLGLPFGTDPVFQQDKPVSRGTADLY